MGKSVTVLPGFTDVEGPSPTGPTVYQSGQTIVYTDAEYSALPAAITRCIGSPTTVPDPARPATDPASSPVAYDTTATGSVTAALGVNVWTLTGNITLAFPVNSVSGPGNQDIFTTTYGPAVGNLSEVELVLIQDGTGSRTLTLPSSAKAAGGSAPVLSTAAGAVDYLKYITYDGGTTWLLVNKQLALH